MKYVCLLALLVLSCHAAQCPPRCECLPEQNQVTCRQVSYQEVRNSLPPNTSRLILDQVPAQNLGRDTLPATLNHLVWRDSNLPDLPTTFLASLTTLQYLDLSGNKIQTLHYDTFAANLELSYLKLSSNQIKTIHVRAFDNLDKLTQLYLNGNQLDLQEQVFSPLWNLEHLDLSHNKISMLENFYFLPNKRLRDLHLNGNTISILSKQALVNLNILQHLDLSHNSIESLPSQIFQDLQQVEYLNISNNLIQSVINDSFSPLISLKSLDLSSNLFTRLSDTTFSKNTKLELLHLDHTKVETIKTELLAPLVNLVEISLSHNPRLTHIDSQAFYNKSRLGTVDVTGNALSTLPLSISALNLTLLSIGDNPWTCDCHMAWFAEWWSQNKQYLVPDKHSLRCAKTIYPDLVNSSLIPTLRALNCTPAEITRVTAEAYYFPRQNVTLVCEVRGEPTPTITWLTPQGLTLHWVPEFSVNPTFRHHPRVHDVHLQPVQQNRLLLLHNGSLQILHFAREDRGNYSCFVSNPFSNATQLIAVRMNPVIIVYAKLESIAFGTLCAFVFLMLTLFVQLLIHLCKRCCQRDSQPKKVQIMLDNIDQCRAQQLSRLQENYALQVSRIKENYVFQAEKIREGYKEQVEGLRTLRRNGTTHLVSLREQYLDQMMRVRDYSTGQLNWVRENYVFQRNRVRKFSAHQMIRIRENYKYQQQALNKMLESLPSLENCKSSCGQSMSTVYDEVDPPLPLQTLSASDSHMSLYLTPPTENLSPSLSTPLARVHGDGAVLYRMMSPQTSVLFAAGPSSSACKSGPSSITYTDPDAGPSGITYTDTRA